MAFVFIFFSLAALFHSPVHTMKIIRARIRGLGDTIETGWFDLSPRLNLFHLPEAGGRTTFLQALAAINPLFACKTSTPFTDVHLVSRRPGYSRRIYPEKRTVALAIFSATPPLVGELAAVNPHLLATDRIEVGRRLDYSRWINFVEIASSTRWQEIASDLQRLADRTRALAPEIAARLADITGALHGSDRIKDGIDLALGRWLASLPAEIRRSCGPRFDDLARAIRRAEDFQLARGIVQRRLPLFTLLADSPLSPDPLAPLLCRIAERVAEAGRAAAAGDLVEELNLHLAALRLAGPRLRLHTPATGGVTLSTTPALPDPATPRGRLLHLQAAVSLAIAFSQATCRTEPVLLFASPERDLPSPLNRRLGDFILSVADFCQCCYGYGSVNIFARHRGLPRYTLADLTGRQF